MIGRRTGAEHVGGHTRGLAGPAPHEHVLRLEVVHLEDAATTREFRCQACGAVWFS